MQTDKKIFDGSTPALAVELGFRWKTPHRADAAFGNAAVPLAACSSVNESAPRDREPSGSRTMKI